MTTLLPPRYEAVSVLGSGGGGHVWAVRDTITHKLLALKALAEGFEQSQVEALVREAVTLSGLEGLGVPRVLRFGRLPASNRPYMVRELVEGDSLLAILQSGGEWQRSLRALAQVAAQLTILHRAGLLHGDVKPANIIVAKHGPATLVDLGLAAPWREGGTRPQGLTPRYAAPELFAGGRLTVRAEVFAIGASLKELLACAADGLEKPVRQALSSVAARATHADPAQRYPSADELASAIRLASRMPTTDHAHAVDASWPIVGVDAAANRLLSRIGAMPEGAVLVIDGKRGSGRTVLVRRAAWTLGVEGRDVAWLEHPGEAGALAALDTEMRGCSGERGMVVLVDEADELPAAVASKLAQIRAAGARIVLVSSEAVGRSLGGTLEHFAVGPLDDDAAESLVRRAIPSLTDALVTHVVRRAEGRPGSLRTIVRCIGAHAVVSTSDIDQLMHTGANDAPTAFENGLDQVHRLLDQGKFEEASALLRTVDNSDPFERGLCEARIAHGRGDANAALQGLLAIERLVPSDRARQQWLLQVARAHLQLGRYAESSRYAQQAVELDCVTDLQRLARALEANACCGLAESFAGEHEKAEAILTQTAARARELGDKRVEAIVLGSLAVALQRAEKLGEARTAYEGALECAQQAGDAGAVANTRLNLAVLAHSEGNLADMAAHLEAAIDMGRRAGRGSTTRQAMLNLANLDIYLGRYARARSSLQTLADQRQQLTATHQAQLIGLEAELAARTGETVRATQLYSRCARAYEALGRMTDAAEAELEGVLLAARTGTEEPFKLSQRIEQAVAALGDATAHRALLGLAKGAVAFAQNDEARAREAYDEALASARAGGQKEWVWRTLEARAALLEQMGQGLAARRDREGALSVLEDIAARLPRDLREVYWDDPRRRAIRSWHNGTAGSPRSHATPADSGSSALALRDASSSKPLPAEERLRRLFEINRELAREHSLERLLERVTDHAIALLHAERGFVILKEEGRLAVHTSRGRGGDDVHALFSSSIAEGVIASGEPIVTLSALEDERMASFLSVHQLQVQSVACVPIRAPDDRTVGALYVETRMRPGSQFASELPTLVAFADQAAIAIESARLLAENRRRADELAKLNAELTRAQDKLKEALGQRTAQLESTRRDLQSTRAVLRGHFGYQGLVGTSVKMRRVYALIDRIKDMDVPVLITGESGTGKEIVARAIHQAGLRSKRPFTGINCGAIPEHLLESELFGHVRGAFTGADRDRKGLLRETGDGTILLDEIGEMPHKMQAGLLRVLQEHVVRPVGGTREEPVSARVIAATNRDLRRMVAEGTFREDLYYRLHVVEVELPPLRERSEDIPILIDHFLNIFAARYRRERKTVTREALRALCACSWPGNVRQLENTLLNAWVMSDRPELDVDDLELTRERPFASTSSASRTPSDELAGSESTRAANPSAREASEKHKILAALEACGWNRLKAAQVAGIPRRTFYRRLKKYGIQ